MHVSTEGLAWPLEAESSSIQAPSTLFFPDDKAGFGLSEKIIHHWPHRPPASPPAPVPAQVNPGEVGV